MSANSEVLRSSELIGSAAEVKASPRMRVVQENPVWSRDAFARDQIRTLVRRVFFNCEVPVRQVLFMAVGKEMELASICNRVGESLALETSARVAVVIREAQDKTETSPPGDLRAPLIEEDATRLTNNLWRVIEAGPRVAAENSGIGQYWASRLAGLRSEFDFVVIQGPAAGSSSEATLLAELADGIVLVLQAGNTRRASARRMKECLQAGSSRILGTVLSERLFPIPERIYKRL